MTHFFSLRAFVCLTAGLCALPAAADEGMWLFNQFPKAAVKAKYGFEVTDAFLDRMRLASVRFNNGGSGSFVSARGLLFTNHHVGSDCIQKLSDAQHNYMANGFNAATEADEKSCPDLEVNVLLRIDDVTEKVTSGMPANAPAAEVNRMQRAAMTRVEKECAATTGNRCDVVTLFSGSLYHLYQYRKYTDIRLVFAPEADIAAFGGDPDNFTFPRYCMDFAFFRAYENGRPVAPQAHFRWSAEGVRDGELTFVPGNPGSTGRLATVAELEFYRDVSYPLVQRRLESMVRTLESYGAASSENHRVARDNLLSQQNSLKAYIGFLAGLRDPKLMARKRADEEKLRAAITADSTRRERYGRIWDEVAAAFQDYRSFYKPYWLFETSATRGTEYLRIARDVLRLSEERSKPNEQRLREYVDSALPSLEQELFSTAPISDSMEIVMLADYLAFLARELGPDDTTVKLLLNARTPQQAAEHYIKTSKLKDVGERRRLAQNAGAARTSEDGMLHLVRLLDTSARALRRQYEDRVQATQIASASRIAQARFAVNGAAEYPDATFTPRVAYGPVRGYRTTKGKPVPFATVTAGLYRRAKNKEPYKLPPSWWKHAGKLDRKTPFNFVTTADTHGGNSGSPTLNTRGEVIGILFDGNIEGLPNRFLYTEEQARSVHVASQVIAETLAKVYSATRLLEELIAR